VGERSPINDGSDGGAARKQLRVGVALTTDPNATRQELDEFCRALGAVIGSEVLPRPVWHYHRLLEGLEDDAVDVVWLPPVLALRASADGLIEPVALPVRNGSSSYQTALFSSADSTIRTVEDLHDLRAAWVDRQSAAGYLIIRAHLRSLGVDLEDAFSADVFLGTYDGVAGAVLDGEVDVGATYVYFDDTDPATAEPRRAGWGRATVHVIARSRPIPADLIAVSRKVPQALRSRIQRALLDGGSGAFAESAARLFDAEGFVAPQTEHLDELTDVLAAMPEAAIRPHSVFPPDEGEQD
jgi:phosphonate transport system substrate-binding protein